jgi:hypothetical protein
MHGINQRVDKGVVWGTTWHELPCYKIQDTPVTNAQVREVLDYGLAKRKLFREDGSPTKVFEVYRTDTGDTLVNSCTETYTIMNNLYLFNYIEEFVLSQAPDIQIESVGTLFSGAVAFVNLKLGEYRIKGDDSETVNRLMYYNPLGRGSYRACSHTIRVVCKNTLNAAEAQGVANQSLVKVPHTKNAEQKLSQAIADIAGIKVGFDTLKVQLNELTRKSFTTETIEHTVKNGLFAYEVSKARIQNARNKVEAILDNTKDEYNNATRSSRYALLQSFTNLLDHTVSKKSDITYAQWDGLVGIRSNAKSRILQELLTA